LRTAATPTRHREATEADLSAISALGMQVNLLHHEAFPQLFAGPADPERDAAHWAMSIAQPMATTFLAEHVGAQAPCQLIGFITVAVVDETHSLMQPVRYGRVGTLGVSPEWRGHGIGRTLMQHAEDWASARGAGELRLNVWAFNEGALRLYRELGYEVRLLTLAKPLAP
jgi:ribosomal protein S18 acetylase RimI-like enzyme